ncbi:Protein-disulfide isomerase [Malonomonas rubra DSM 5091]|uniref:Protein-disulfide isomerase n=1 Tax=Malonomonas rubra DSM 5091 TaxID=1122189 RepID=A0A1M6N864_MALRU|nr:thioredoxin domain-containing protein [Malonomonas rubra]SHJ91736.1 Protein-disulfide isomerase [Malonomonas rubra DSM 5091]
MKYALVGITVLVLALGFIIGTNYYKDQQVKKYGFMAAENRELFIRDHSRTLGSDDAKVILIEFMDPACETCAAFSPFVKKIMAANPGKIKLVLRYAPFHDGADNFVKIVEAAGKQGKYWETLELMFKTQGIWANHGHWQPEKLWDLLPRAGVDVDQIRKDMHNPEIAKIIEQDMADVKALNVQKTPGYFVNGKPLQTFGYRQLQNLIQTELNLQYPN